MSEATPALIADVIVEVEIEASLEKVWGGLTEGIGAWWPPEFYAGGEEGQRSYHLDATPGGRMFETWDGGGGLIWGQVAMVDPGKGLQVIGHTFPGWGGPSTWFGSWQLSEAESGGCNLRFTESTVGRISDGNLDEKKRGWKYLFDGVLRAHVEGKPIPAWVD